jgi:hypothetical protein
MAISTHKGKEEKEMTKQLQKKNIYTKHVHSSEIWQIYFLN